MAGRRSVVVRDRGRLCGRWEVSDAVAGNHREYCSCYGLWQKETLRVCAACERCAKLQPGAALLVSGIAYNFGRLSGSALAPGFGSGGAAQCSCPGQRKTVHPVRGARGFRQMRALLPSVNANSLCKGKCCYFLQPARGARGFEQMRASLPSVIAESFCRGTQC